MRITETEDSEPFKTTHKWLQDHNGQHVSGEWIPVRLLAHDDEGDLAGSLDAEVTLGMLHVSNVVVAPGRRHGGIGTQLMQAGEAAAKKLGCSGIYLETMSFQALDFYLRLGFTKAGEVAGFENATVMYLLHKAI